MVRLVTVIGHGVKLLPHFIKHYSRYVDEINIPENYFTIAYDNAIFESYKDYDFFWDFTGIRTDVPELITEL